MDTIFKDYLLQLTESSDCVEVETIQSLWSGYGYISRCQIYNGTIDSAVVKCIQLQTSSIHPRGWNTNFGHQRKLRSYEVETHWYQSWSKDCDELSKIPNLIGVFELEDKRWIVLEDLKIDFPLVKNHVTLQEVKVCLHWLAHFHGRFLNASPEGLWEIGTYWHLQTRPEEYATMENGLLKSKAHEIDNLLNHCEYKTIVHGDAKLANFCFSEDGKRVAAVDFQYVGGGCGMKDVAYFLGSCLSSEDCEFYEIELLNYYFENLRIAINKYHEDIDFKALEIEWRNMYPIASIDFTRFLMGWMPTHQKLNAYTLKIMNTVLSKV